jgi:hypothetical protein
LDGERGTGFAARRNLDPDFASLNPGYGLQWATGGAAAPVPRGSIDTTIRGVHGREMDGKNNTEFEQSTN